MPIKRATILGRGELLAGAMVGANRHVDAITASAAETVAGVGEDGKGWSRHIEGALCEAAFAKLTGRYWDASLGRFRYSETGDVGTIQVRGTEYPDGHLVVRDHDPDDAVFALVVGSDGHYGYCGYIRGADAKRDQWRKDPGDRGAPCWWVPQAVLL